MKRWSVLVCLCVGGAALAVAPLRSQTPAPSATAAPAGGDPAGEPLAADLLERARAEPLAAGKAVGVTPLARSALLSLHLVQLRTVVEPHYHAEHDETVAVLAGRGTLVLGDRTLALGPGSTLFIPRGTVHAVTNADTSVIVVALSCFTPPFDGADRHFVEPGPTR